MTFAGALPFQVFLSSPGDVAEARGQVRELLLGLARGPFVRGRVLIDVVSWDDRHGGATMDARFAPQHSVNRSLPPPADCDITVVLMWSRMGTPIAEKKEDGMPCLSGTEWEFEDAIRADKPTFAYQPDDLGTGAARRTGRRLSCGARGGSFNVDEFFLRAAARGGSTPDTRSDLVAFRVVSSRLRPV